MRALKQISIVTWLVLPGSFAAAAESVPDKVPAACAGEDCDEAATKGWTLAVGANGLTASDRSGGRRYLFHPIPFAHLSYGDVFEASSRDGIDLALYADQGVKAGPLFDLDRRERAAPGVPGRPFAAFLGTGGIGGFAEWTLPQESKTRLEITEGVLARRGVKAEFTLSRTYALAPGLELDLGAKLRGGDRLYVESIYRAPRLGHVASPRRRAGEGGGVTTIGPTSEARYELGKADTVSSTVEANRLVGVAARSQATRGNVGRHSAGTLEFGWQHKLISSE